MVRSILRPLHSRSMGDNWKSPFLTKTIRNILKHRFAGRLDTLNWNIGTSWNIWSPNFLRKVPPMTTVGRPPWVKWRPPSPCPPLRDFPNTLLNIPVGRKFLSRKCVFSLIVLLFSNRPVTWLILVNYLWFIFIFSDYAYTYTSLLSWYRLTKIS